MLCRRRVLLISARSAHIYNVSLTQNRKTVGFEVERREYDGFCRRIGVSPEDGLSEDALFELYAQPGNDVNTDFRALFPKDLPMDGGERAVGGSSWKGWCFGRRTKMGDGDPCFFLGPLVAADTDTATALVVAALRGAAVETKLRSDTATSGAFSVQLIGLEGPDSNLEMPKRVLESLGFKPGSQSRYMVREAQGSAIYPTGGRGVIAAAGFEYA